MYDFVAGTSLHGRAMSGFPLSIGTALAMETVFTPTQKVYDPQRSLPPRLELSQYQAVWINVTTLFRNLASSVEKDVFVNAKPNEFAAVLEDEMAVIMGLFQTEGGGVCRPQFYASDYQDLFSRNTPGLSFRTPHTEAQKFTHIRLEQTLKLLDKHSDQLHRWHGALETKHHESAFVLTHQPYDLVSYSKFGELLLLESNTGMVKPKARWNSKYYPLPNDSMAHLPFHQKLLLALGDKVLIKPTPMVLRKLILTTSLKRHWTPATTLDKVKLDLSLDITDPYMAAVWKAL